MDYAVTLQDPGDSFFPYNAVRVIQQFMMQIDPDTHIIRRRLVGGDPNQSIGITPVDWKPLGKELGAPGPSLQEYTIFVQSLIVDPDIERGLRMHSFFAKQVREMLARMVPLSVGLRELETTDSFGVRERTTDVSMGTQVFHSLETEGEWNWLSTAELRLSTQTFNGQ